MPQRHSPFSPPGATPVASNAPRAKAKSAVVPITVCLICLLTVPGLSLYVIARPAYNRTILSKIRPGMDKPQVSKIMGPPDGIYGTYEWEYSRWGNAGWVEVWFDENGLVTYTNDESVFP